MMTDGNGPERGRWLAQRISRAGQTNAQFSASAGITYQTVARMINGGHSSYGHDIRYLRPDTARRLTLALIGMGEDIEDILSGLMIPEDEQPVWRARVDQGERTWELSSLSGPLSVPVACRVVTSDRNAGEVWLIQTDQGPVSSVNPPAGAMRLGMIERVSLV